MQELKDSKQKLEEKLDIKIDSFAYPSGKGATNRNIRQMVFDSGYVFDFSTKRGINSFSNKNFLKHSFYTFTKSP